MEKKENNRVDKLIEELDVSEFKERYNRYYNRYMQFYDTANRVRKFLEANYTFITDKIWDMEDDIEQLMKEVIEDDNEEESREDEDSM